jgi:hypothetical protein
MSGCKAPRIFFLFRNRAFGPEATWGRTPVSCLLPCRLTTAPLPSPPPRIFGLQARALSEIPCSTSQAKKSFSDIMLNIKCSNLRRQMLPWHDANIQLSVDDRAAGPINSPRSAGRRCLAPLRIQGPIALPVELSGYNQNGRVNDNKS